MVPDGRLGGERTRVGGAVLLVRETAPQKTWFGRFIRGGRGVGPGDEGELEVEGARMCS